MTTAGVWWFMYAAAARAVLSFPVEAETCRGNIFRMTRSEYSREGVWGKLVWNDRNIQEKVCRENGETCREFFLDGRMGIF